MTEETFEEDPIRIADRFSLEAITSRLDEQGDSALDEAILHPHAILDTAYRRVQESGLAENNTEVVATVMAMWTDGFMAGQRAMAQSMGIDLDDHGMDT